MINEVDAPEIPDEVLINEARAGSLEARNKLLVKYKNIIDIVVKKMRYSDIDEGTKRFGAIMGLHAAIDGYKDRGRGFGCYAYFCATRKAQREMSGDWIIKLPVNLLAKYLKNETRPYDVMSLSVHAESIKWYQKIDDNGREIKNRTMSELITNDNIQDSAAKIIMKEALNELTELERDAIYQKNGLIEESLKEVGERHGVSHEWIRRKAISAQDKLKKIFIKKAKEIAGQSNLVVGRLEISKL